MQNQSELHTIDGESYEFYMMPPGKALKILVQLLKRSLGPVGGALNSDNISLAELMKQKINLEGLLSRLAENLDADWAHQTILQLLEHVRHQGGTQLVFEVEFTGKLFHVLKIVGKALEVNYQDFIQGLHGVLPSVPGLEPAKK